MTRFLATMAWGVLGVVLVAAAVVATGLFVRWLDRNR
jgi:hypothetical protein